MAKVIETDYSKFTDAQNKLLNFYLQNEMNELKKVCHFVWGGKGIQVCDYDDLYSDAMNVLVESIVGFDETKNIKFKTYFTNNVKRSYLEWYRDNYLRSKRKNFKRDKDGKIEKDENGKPIIIKDVSFDAPTDDGIDLKEKISVDNCIDEESENVSNYLNSISETERKIANLIIEGYELYEAKEILHISDKMFEKYLSNMRSFEKHRILKHCDSIIEEEIKMSTNYTQTMEKSKPDKLSIASIIKKINNYTIRFDHPLQRASEQWTNAMKGNLISDILQANPIPALIFAEQIVNGVAIIWDLDGKQRCTISYSFANDGFRVSKNVRRGIISYQAIIKNEMGGIVLDENGFPQIEHKEFDIRGKKFSDLPEELQDKFMDYNFEIVQYLNCSAEDIAYHIARYNEGRPMNNQQKGIIQLGERFASLAKGIAAMPFFREMGNYKVSEVKNSSGILDRVVVESIMNINFLEDWTKEQTDMCRFIKENATEEMFESFEDLVERLSNIADENTLEKFDSKNSFIWFGLFARFIETGVDDEKFIEFMAEFSRSLHSKKIDGVSFDELCVNENGKSRSTKDKYIVVPKMEKLIYLMDEFLDINVVETVKLEENADSAKNEESANAEIPCFQGISECKKTDETVLSSEIEKSEDNESVLNFVRENANPEAIEEDIKFYDDYLNDTIRMSSQLYHRCKEALIAMVAYSVTNEQDQEFLEWIKEYQDTKTDFADTQKENFVYMKTDFDNYLSHKAVA